MIEAEDIPEAVRDMLRAVRKNAAPTAIIAGGYLRDLDNKREPKDIDLFIENRHMPHVQDELQRLGFESRRDAEPESAEGDPSVVTQQIWTHPKFDLEVNVIAAKDENLTPQKRYLPDRL